MNDIHYNTGKVKIGSAYCINPLRYKYIEEDRDMLTLQKCLISDPCIQENKNVAKSVALAIVFFIGLIIWLRLK
jgi:hypothetical protein